MQDLTFALRHTNGRGGPGDERSRGNARPPAPGCSCLDALVELADAWALIRNRPAASDDGRGCYPFDFAGPRFRRPFAAMLQAASFPRIFNPMACQRHQNGTVCQLQQCAGINRNEQRNSPSGARAAATDL